jgi:hypothetical protein
METNFNFKSQVATSREQSERLLALGLKKETADMCLVPLMEWDDCTAQEYFTGIYVTRTKEDVERYNLDYIPAWSLHRLLSLYNLHYIEFMNDEEIESVYNIVIDAIEQAIKEGYLNKEYLV